jgi:hypothetical protein
MKSIPLAAAGLAVAGARAGAHRDRRSEEHRHLCRGTGIAAGAGRIGDAGSPGVAAQLLAERPDRLDQGDRSMNAVISMDISCRVRVRAGVR